MVLLDIDTRPMRQMIKTLQTIEKGVARVLPPSINRALNKGRTEVRREIRKEYLIKQKDIPIRVRGANASRLNGTITLAQGMMDLGKFKVQPRTASRRENRRPITAQVKAHGGAHALKTGFMVRNLAYKGPYVRLTKARFPIKKLITIGAPIMASQPHVGPVANQAMGETLAKELDRNFKRVMAQAGGRAV